MMTGKHNSARSLDGIGSHVADAELNSVSGGDKKTTTKPTTTPTIKPIVFTLQQVLVSSY
jgi:hypothetical protein